MISGTIGESVVVFDTETTGVDRSKDQPIEISAVKIHLGTGKTISDFSMLARPGVPVSKSAQDIHGIPPADIAAAKPVADVVREFFYWVEGTKTLWAYSAGFDRDMVQNVIDQPGFWEFNPGKRLFPDIAAIQILDILEVVRSVGHPLLNYKLDNVMRSMNIFMPGRHRALWDAIGAACVLGRITMEIAPTMFGVDTTLSQMFGERTTPIFWEKRKK